MRINAHAHIFNLQPVLTREAVEIIARRIGERGAPEFVVEAVARLPEVQLDRPEYLIEDELLEERSYVAATLAYRVSRPRVIVREVFVRWSDGELQTRPADRRAWMVGVVIGGA